MLRLPDGRIECISLMDANDLEGDTVPVDDITAADEMWRSVVASLWPGY